MPRKREPDSHPGRPEPVREWYPSGALRAELDRVREDGTFESETWHENGRSAGVEARELGFGYTSDGHLITLRVSAECPEADLARLTFRVHSVLDLAGPGVTDAVVGRLDGLAGVEDLVLSRTTITARGLGRFRGCTNLKSLQTRRNTGFTAANVRALLADLPGCEWDDRPG